MRRQLRAAPDQTLEVTTIFSDLFLRRLWHFSPEEQKPLSPSMRNCTSACGIRPPRDDRNSFEQALVGIPSKVRILSGWESVCRMVRQAYGHSGPSNFKKRTTPGARVT